ncbi:hypothetical protein GCM10022252_03670 [Streptosporangium oxazolinicum]|uniref:Uncharacterized protein n=1 Tax=Streptosporangium oxazolinicum TaxID=909287 RepID=A0ABP8AA92_9ACTN
MSGGAAADADGAVNANGMARIAAMPMVHRLRIMLLGSEGVWVPRAARTRGGCAPYSVVVRLRSGP